MNKEYIFIKLSSESIGKSHYMFSSHNIKKMLTKCKSNYKRYINNEIKYVDYFIILKQDDYKIDLLEVKKCTLYEARKIKKEYIIGVRSEEFKVPFIFNFKFTNDTIDKAKEQIYVKKRKTYKSTDVNIEIDLIKSQIFTNTLLLVPNDKLYS